MLVLAVAACGGPELERGEAGFVQGFFGAVAADEPRAALVGRDVLAVGGSAADAATAIYFALSVTMPSSASLGGGGTCVVFDHKTGVTEALEFLARPPRRVDPRSSRPSAVPGNPRGFFALHAKYGVLRWEQVVAPAENIARFGNQVSRAFATDLAAVEAALLREPESRRIFASTDGSRLVREGEFFRQVDLAGVLGRLRSQGPGDFYGGTLAATLVAATREAGGTLSLEDLRAYAPRWRKSVTVETGNEIVHFAPPPTAGGLVAAQMWAALARDDFYDDDDPASRAHGLAEVFMRTYADRSQWMADDGNVAGVAEELVSGDHVKSLMSGFRQDRHTPAERLTAPPRARPENPAATTFVVVDREASAVACGLTLNNLFGTGRVARGMGIVLAAVPGPGGRGAISLGPMIVVNANVNEFHFAAAASGGVTAPSAMIQTAVASFLAKGDLDTALAAPRLHHSGEPDLIYYEPDLPRPVLDRLLDRGYRIAPTPMLGRVNAIYCPGALPPKPELCSAVTDPRGSGLAVLPDK